MNIYVLCYKVNIIFRVYLPPNIIHTLIILFQKSPLKILMINENGRKFSFIPWKYGELIRNTIEISSKYALSFTCWK